MTAGRRMKHEMMVAQRKRRQKQPPTLEQKMEEQGVTDNDRAELRRFAAYLSDAHAGMPLIDQIEKHGADYLGFTPAEVATIKAQTPGCRGTACGTTTGEHSAECVAEHARAVAGLPRA